MIAAGAVAVGVLLVVVLLVVGLSNRGVGSSIDEAIREGERPPAPDLTLPVLVPGGGVGPAGKEVSLSDLRGRPVLLNVWASWCPPCAEEAPVLEAIWRDYRARGLLVLGIDIEDLSSDARAFVRSAGLTFPSLRDAGSDAKARLEVTGVPETLLVDAEGRIALRLVGPIVDGDREDGIRRAVESLL
jgi:cytochrome c biogenesis protein CcmG/thiol:disulfide interchange protein DsbE